MPVTGMPPGELAESYPDLQSQLLEGSIETQGARLAWSRAIVCPCAPINSQTLQPDLNCERCKGEGTYYFGEQDYAAPDDIGELDETQQAIIDAGAVVIRGVIGRSNQTEDFYDPLGRWRWGKMFCTVRYENRLAYHDRLVNLDSTIVHSEQILVPARATTLTTRYPVVSVDYLMTNGGPFDLGTSISVDSGVVTFTTPPVSSTRMSVRYHTHPVWLVTDIPHAIREVSRRFPATGAAGVFTPVGTVTRLPIMAQIELEMIPVNQGE